MNEHFYTGLPLRRMRLRDLLKSGELSLPVPPDWLVVVTDIRGSTRAVEAGRQEDVNLVAVGAIVLALNIAWEQHIGIPFFFGGDGATLLLPASLQNAVESVLKHYQATVLSAYELELRVGSVPVADVYAAGKRLQLSKYSSGQLAIPVVLGDGLQYAEMLVKGAEAGTVTATGDADLSGVQCRWDHIAVPEDKEEIVTLMVAARQEARQGEVYSQVITKIDEIYGQAEKRRPLSTARLHFQSGLSKLSREMRFRLGQLPFWELLVTWVKNLYGHIWFRTEAGKAYMHSLVERADTLVLDGRINTIMSGSAAQRRALSAALDELEDAGLLYYGLHTGQASVMTCFVRDLKDDHIHFIDGEQGGYTQAAKMLKAKSDPSKKE